MLCLIKNTRTEACFFLNEVCFYLLQIDSQQKTISVPVNKYFYSNPVILFRKKRKNVKKTRKKCSKETLTLKYYEVMVYFRTIEQNKELLKLIGVRLLFPI